MGSKSKPKATLGCATQILDANLTNATFGFLPAVGWKGKSPASVSRRVDLKPDLDLLGGFAFLSFESLDELETHIEHNETNSAAISVNVGQKGKAEGSGKRHGDNCGLFVPPSKKKAAKTSKKKPPKQISTLTTASGTKAKHNSPADDLIKSKVDKVSLVGTILGDGELSQSTPIDISASGSELNAQSSPNVFSEISLLCSETVDLGDDEDSAREIFKKPEKAVVYRGDGHLDMCAAQFNQSESAVEGIGTSTDPVPKKKKKKKRKNEHCDQTSQTKFRIKKKKKSEPKARASEKTPNMLLDQLENDEFPDLQFQDVKNLQSKCDGDEDDKNTLAKSLSSKPKIENAACARTSVYHGCSRDGSFKTKLLTSESAGGEHLIDLTCNTSSELSQAKMTEKNSLDGCTPHSSDRDDETSVSVLSDLSDHSSDIEMSTDRCGCFLLNNKIEKVEKEETEKREIVDVDVETVGKEMRKNFLVVSGIEAGHFSYHPDMTKDGTIDTSIQALPNEIDIFLQCAKMQEGELIKIINPDDSDELHSHFTQKNGRNPDTSNKKATRSATERKRRHHLGDLFNDMKLEVFTDLVEADLYFSKQSILSKGISTIEELEKESKELSNKKRQLLKTHKTLKEKRNLLMFGKESIDVDSAKVEAIFQRLDIQVDDEEPSKTEENLNSSQDVVVDVPSELKPAVEPSVKGRPRAKKTLLSPWVSNNKPALKSKDDQNTIDVNLVKKATTPSLSDTSKELLGTTTSSQTLPSLNITNVSCGVQTQEASSTCLKSFTSGHPPLSQSLPPDNSTTKSKPLNESASQEGPKANLVKILPKPATILQLNPTQHRAIIDTLGQVKQPSSDKIICNLSRLSTTQNPSSPSSICIIRSGPLMKSLDSKNVTHLKITNDALKNVDNGSGSTSSTAPTSSLSQQVLNTPATARVPGFVTLGVAKMPETPGTSSGQTSKQYSKNTVLQVSQIPLKSTSTPISSTAKLIFAGKPLGTLASTSTTEMAQSTVQTNADITLRALASLSQLQANRPPIAGTETKPVAVNENPVAGILSGLKNVVMKVVPSQPEMQSTTSVLPTLPTASITTIKGATSSHVAASSQGNIPVQPRKFSVIPIISVPSSSLNSSFTASSFNQPLSSSGTNSKAVTSTPLIKTCLDPFNLVPRELASSNSPICLEPDLPSASVDLETDISNQLDNLTSSESPSPISDDIFKEEPSTSSTVLTQEMLKIPGIEQRPDVPLAKLPEVFENLADLDKTTDAAKSPKPWCGVEERKPEGSVVCNLPSLSHGAELQTDTPTLSLRSSTIGAKKSTSPLKVEIKDFRKGKPLCLAICINFSQLECNNQAL